MSKKLLVVDDDPAVLQVLKKYFSANGFGVITADNGSEAVSLARESDPDLMIIDANMPGLDGHALTRVLRKDGSSRATPIIMISGDRLSDQDKIGGLDGGADDYVAKPFSLPVLLARVRAVLRRGAGDAAGAKAVKTSGIEMDLEGRVAKVKGKILSLTRKEFDLLATLMSRSGRLLSVPFLLETVWGYDLSVYNDPATVEVHVSHLRRKLGARLAKRIVNLPGYGYKFEA
ncbi:MAG: response regulator transcription factor [Elusimicrobia bacterium]|nr:response regulator transcription factor [Elusimicrobiota bacterium]